jgi:predicted ATPase/DNA-binding winged helix-turn-helix (wHTH) protein
LTVRSEAKSRQVGPAPSKRVYRFGEFRLLSEQRLLLRGDQPIALTPRALSVLIALVERHDRIVTKNEIYASVWGDTIVEDGNLTVQVSTLRKALGSNVIATIPGRGYKFVEVVAAPDSPAPAAGEQAPPPVPPVSNLPRNRDSVIGRASDLAELTRRIERDRLLTLTGPSGVGKTRLAVELGLQLAGIFPDGVRLADLAPLGDPGLVPSALALALDVPLRAAEAPLETIAAAIAERKLLLIVDNCEHLVAAVAEAIHALLLQVPGLSVLATSQETLHLPGEQVYRLAPLAVPPPDAEAVAEFGAVALFAARAAAADRRFALTAANGPDVAEICRRLDGNPLALEMAAARLPLLGLGGLRAGLDERLRMLGTTAPASAWRHRTLRDMVVWSCGLLDAAERCMFHRLGVFAGSFTLQAATTIAGDARTDADHWASVDTLGQLVDKSLVTVDDGNAPRYRLLDTLRLYALEGLAGAGTAATLAAQHARYFAGLSACADAAWETMPAADWLARYRPEIDNIRAATNWALAEPAQAALAVDLITGAARLWFQLDLLAEGRHYLGRATTLVDARTAPEIEARLQEQTALLWQDFDPPLVRSSLDRALSLFRQLDDRDGMARVLVAIGRIYTLLGRDHEAGAALDEAAALLAGRNQKKTLSVTLRLRGILATRRGDFPQARRDLTDALDIVRALGDIEQENRALFTLAELEFQHGSPARAIELARGALDRIRTSSTRFYRLVALVMLATYLIAENDTAAARPLAAEALSLVRDEDGHITAVCLQHAGLFAALDGACEAAARIGGFVDAAIATAGLAPEPTEQATRDRLAALLDAALPPTALAVLLSSGAGMTQKEVVALAKQTLNADPAR